MPATAQKPAVKPAAFVEENPPEESKPEDKKPAAKKPAAKPSTAKKGRPSVRDKRASDLKELFDMFGGTIMLFDQEGGSIITDNSENVANAWADLAEKEAKVAKVLDNLFKTGAYTNVTIATLGMVVPLLAHYGLLPKGLMNPFSLFSMFGGQDEGTAAGSPDSPVVGL